MSLIPRGLEQDFFAPFFSGWPFDTRELMALPGAAAGGQQLATRSVPVDISEVGAANSRAPWLSLCALAQSIAT